MKNILLAFLLLAVHLSSAQNLNHSILTIPQDLKENANAIFRLEETQINMESPYSMTIKEHLIVTVFNKYGDVDAKIKAYYDNHSQIKAIKATIYNAFGFEIKKIRSKDIKDYAASGGSLYSDNRVKIYSYIPLKYPYTIDYTIITETNNTAFYPKWYPIHGYYASTQVSRFTIDYPNNQLKITAKEDNFEGYNIVNNSTPGHIDYSVKNLKAIEKEPYAPKLFFKFAPVLKLAPNKFNLAGVKGEVNNWNEFGQWMYSNLLLGRDNLSEQTKSEVKNLVKGIEDPIERARKVYAYMQDKTRYISVQIGVGGWKPMLAEEVDKMKYGDCKALVNYTQSLLKEANVNTYYTLVFAKTKKDIEKDFVAYQGNHAILYLPTEKDTIWLECTTQTQPFGYVGRFTNDRDVLVVKPDGAQIKHTTSYKNADSYQISNGAYSIDNDGTLTGDLKIKSAGIQFDDHFDIANLKKNEIIDYYKDYFDNINNLNIEKYNIKTDRIENIFNEKIKLSATNYGRISGERMLLTLNAFNKMTYVPSRSSNRRLPFEITDGYLDKDSTVINLPKSYKIEAMPNASQIKTKFGIYNSEIILKNDSTLIYKRSLAMNKGYYPKEEYTNFRKFRKSIVRKDNSKIILIKQ